VKLFYGIDFHITMIIITVYN